MHYAYPFEMAPDDDMIGGTFPDVMGAHTFAPDRAACLARAQDCLIAALGICVDLRKPVPAPSPARGRPMIAVPLLVAAKLALHEAMLQSGISNSALARRLGRSEGAIRRLLDLDHRSHIDTVDRALRYFGRQIEVTVRAA